MDSREHAEIQREEAEIFEFQIRQERYNEKLEAELRMESEPRVKYRFRTEEQERLAERQQEMYGDKYGR